MENIVQRLKGDLGKELAIIDLYQKYVKEITDPVARQLFLQMISESMGHADAFRKLLYKKTLGVELHNKGISEVALGNLLYYGMKEEREIRLQYEEDLEHIQDEEYASLLRNIIEDEKRHEAMLKQAYEELKSEKGL